MTPEDLRRAAEALRGAELVAIACHVNPDPDALGSMLGLAQHLTTLGVSTICSYPNEPLDVPRWADGWTNGVGLVAASAFPERPEVMVTCDCASLDRLQGLGRAATNANELIWIDHHRSNDGLGTVRLVDPDASSTCELVVRLIEAMGGELGDATARWLYAGLVTDTGRFQYQATSPATLRVAATLRERSFDHAALARTLYEDSSLPALRLLAAALGRLEHVPGADLVWTYLVQDDLKVAGVGPADTDDLIDVIRTAREADVAALLKQQRDGRFKVSVRSRGGHDLSVVAARFGGGGHRLAAGYTSPLAPAATVAALVDALGEQV